MHICTTKKEKRKIARESAKTHWVSLQFFQFIYLWEKKPEIPLKMRKVNGLLWAEKGEEEQ